MDPLTLTCWEAGARSPANGRVLRLSWNDLAMRVERPRPPRHEGDKLRNPLWSFATFREGYRRADGVLEVYALVVDLDSNPEAPVGAVGRGSPDLRLEEIQAALRGVCFFAHTTWSHTDGGARWRVGLPLSRPCTAAEIGSIARAVAERLRRAGVEGVDTDRTWAEPSRGYVVPVRRAGRPFVGFATPADLPLLDVESALASTRTPDTRRTATVATPNDRATRYGEAALAHALASIRGAPAGQRNATLFREAAGLGGLIAGGACGLVRPTVEAELVSAAEGAGLSRGEGLDTARRALDAGASTPRVPPEEASRPTRGDPPRLPPTPSAAATAPERPWPMLDARAYHGLAGELVRLVEPHTEADPVAVLVHLLAAFGAWVGRAPHVQVGGDRHSPNLFVAIVGRTGSGRKGTAWGEVRRALGVADPRFTTDNIRNGLSSGEGLIHAVRDASAEPPRAGGAGGKPPREADPGVTDKRLFVVEPEFARQLQAMRREGNTLSAQLRMAWDSGDLSVMTRDPYRATGAHIAVVAHVTRDELLRLLDSTEYANGFGNRFLWACARRSKELPDGGAVPARELAELALRLTRAAERGRARGALERSPAAAERWRAEYSTLTRERSGVYGELTRRAAPLVLRLALVYALLDASDAIEVPHLEAALAVWQYCSGSVRWVFGDSLGDRTADAILAALRATPAGLTRTEIRDRLSRNAPEATVARALATLAEEALARRVIESTGGRPADRWFACGS